MLLKFTANQSDRGEYLPGGGEAAVDVVLVHPVLQVPDPERPHLVRGRRCGCWRRGLRRGGVVRLLGRRLRVVRLRWRLSPHRRQRRAVLLLHRRRDPTPLRRLPTRGVRWWGRCHAGLRRRGLLHHGVWREALTLVEAGERGRRGHERIGSAGRMVWKEGLVEICP
jgi:hypothetical protein